ncbi:TetR/AcrR family transcriptional regulator [Spartinivicinus poritis]|uniref:TetR/AcrR family transcriptional regulator n=1 Tax=Spartinivicinus poritis TaxID=2994640 RepID=A0ABT5UF14_9GAMM|nr:TetR/AcrR family transcriptional regulator [Spartinivicinus sp. A2-2]MDE1463679.1 TetR/AcrR family transcriptional regulator [Spartinivicinus sp. A2-2]
MCNTRQKILEAGVKELAANPNASMEAIATSAGVSRMTINRYFSNRKKLLESIVLYVFEKYQMILDEAVELHEKPVEQLKYYVYSSITFGDITTVLKHHADFDESEHDPNTCQFSDTNKKLKKIITRMQRSKQVRQGVPVFWVLQLLDSILFASWEAIKQGRATEKEATLLAWDSFSYAVLKEVD